MVESGFIPRQCAPDVCSHLLCHTVFWDYLVVPKKQRHWRERNTHTQCVRGHLSWGVSPSSEAHQTWCWECRGELSLQKEIFQLGVQVFRGLQKSGLSDDSMQYDKCSSSLMYHAVNSFRAEETSHTFWGGFWEKSQNSWFLHLLIFCFIKIPGQSKHFCIAALDHRGIICWDIERLLRMGKLLNLVCTDTHSFTGLEPNCVCECSFTQLAAYETS